MTPVMSIYWFHWLFVICNPTFWELVAGNPILNPNLNIQLSALSSFQSLSHLWLFATPWTAASQASLSITNSQSLLKLMFIESVMPSNHLALPCPLLPHSIFPSIRVFSNESALHIRWPNYRPFPWLGRPLMGK